MIKCMKAGLYNLFRIPYYRALITKDGDVIGTKIIRLSTTNLKYFRSKKHRGLFILPKLTDKPPLRMRSGYILVYDLRNPFPLKLTSGDDERDISGDDVAFEPMKFTMSPVDTEELHNFLEAKVTEDILSDNAKEIPMWLIYLVSIGIIAVLILGAFYMMTKGQTPVYINGQPYITPIPTPTPGYVVIP